MPCNIFYDLVGGSKIPAIGYGTWLANDENELEVALETALEVGYRHIDTAFIYQNEKVVGKVIYKWITAGKLTRDDIFVVTKLTPSAMRKESVSKYLKASLNNLQLDYVDMFLIHVPFGFNDVDGNLCPMKEDGTIDMDVTTDLLSIWKAMEGQVDVGLTKTIGISNFNEIQIRRILDVARIPPSCLQVELHAYFQQRSLKEFCDRNNIIVTAYSPLGNPGLSKLGVQLPDILGNPTVHKLARKYNKTAAQILLRHLLQKKIVVIPKSIKPDRVRENFDIFDFELCDMDMAKMDKLDAGIRILDFGSMFNGIKNHPEYPFGDAL